MLPLEPTSGDDLIADAIANDPDGDTLTLRYAWTRDGSPWGTDRDTVAAIDTTRGQTWSVTVTVSDGVAEVQAASDPVLIANAPAQVTEALLTPDPAYVGSTFEVTASVEDTDLDPITVSYRWAINGLATGDTGIQLVPGAFLKGDEVHVSVTADDGLDAGTPLASNVIVVSNSPPSIVSIALDPAEILRTGEPITCSWLGYSDADSDPDVSGVTWTIDAVEVGDQPTLTEGFVGGQVVTCTVTPHDGEDPGDALSLSLVVANTAPSLVAVSIAPDPAFSGDALTCSWSGFADADGDADLSTVAWTVNGNATVETTEVLTTELVRGDVVTCTVTPDDGQDAGSPVTESLVLSNTAPAIAAVAITPDPASIDDVLTCTWSDYIDVDGDPDDSSAAWTVNGVAAGSGPRLARGYSSGDTVTCTVTPNDGFDDGTPVSASLSIDNAVPSIDAVRIDPDPGYVADTLTCSWTGWSDGDGDADASTVAWTVAGTTVGTATTLAGAFAKHDDVTCAVTPDDGVDTGTPVSAALAISNTPPTLSAASISPSIAVVGDTLTCAASGFADDDGDSDQTGFTWRVNGAMAGTGATLSGGFVGGDTVLCTATPNDGEHDGTAVSDTLTVNNTAPSITAVAIAPDPGLVSDPLVCSWSGYSDADGDADASSVTWTVGGSTVGTDATLTSGYARGDVVTCQVTPSDGADDGTPMSASVTIANSIPTLATVAIAPDPGFAVDTLVCTWAGYADADGDPDNSSLSWAVNGTTVGSSAALGVSLIYGDVARCTVTPDDGTDTGTPVSATLTVSNTPPVLSAVVLSPDPAWTDDTITCNPGSTSDADGTPSFTFSYAWTVDTAKVAGQTGTTLSEDHFTRGQEVVCSVTPSDGTDQGDAVSSDKLTIQNSAPVIDGLSFSPSTVQTDDDLTAVASTSDRDGDTPSLSYAWQVDGSPVPESSATLGGSAAFDKHQVVVVTISITDGTSAGDDESASITVQNTKPPAPTLRFADDEPVEAEDDLVCELTEGVDADGDTIAYTFTWEVDGSLWTGATDTTTWTDDTISADNHLRGETWTCAVVPNDGEQDGSSVTASVTSLGPFAGWSDATVWSDDADVEFYGAAKSVWGGADIDGDGVPELIFGEPNNSRFYVAGGAETLAEVGGSQVTLSDTALHTVILEDPSSSYAKHFAVDVSAGDVDGDGLADVLVGCWYCSDDWDGRAFLFTGALLGDEGDLTVDSEGGDHLLISPGTTAYEIGYRVAANGDIDGDGLDDLIIGSWGGEAAWFTAATLGSDTLVDFDSADVMLSSSGLSGSIAAFGGDIDGDGLTDSIVGDNATVRIFLASSVLSATSFGDQDYAITGSYIDVATGGGDLDGDGYDDFVIGASSSNCGATRGGDAYVYLGDATGYASGSGSAGDGLATFCGDGRNDYGGFDVDLSGDVDHDGLNDLLIGARESSASTSKSGQAYLWLSTSFLDGGSFDMDEGDQLFESSISGAQLGGRLSFAGDLDQDGLDDILLAGYGEEWDTATSSRYAWLWLATHR
jgi:hypothetical protein